MNSKLITKAFFIAAFVALASISFDAASSCRSEDCYVQMQRCQAAGYGELCVVQYYRCLNNSGCDIDIP